MNGVQTRFKCKLDVKRCKRFVFPPSSLLPRSNALKTKAIRYFQTDQTLTRIVSSPLDTDEHLFLKVVNPLRYPKEGEECELFRSTDKVRMAWGVTHLLDNVPYKEGSLLRNMIINHLGRSQYYRCFRKERPFAPQDQQTIRMLFRQRGISEEPSFDYYTNEFNW